MAQALKSPSHSGNVVSPPETLEVAKTLPEIVPRNQAWESGPADIGQSSHIDDCLSILILDPAAEHAMAIVEGLQERGISATAFQTKQGFLQFLEMRDIDMAVIVLHSKSWWRDELRLFWNSIRYLQQNAEIICILRWPEECPLDRLYGDTLDVTVLHE